MGVMKSIFNRNLLICFAVICFSLSLCLMGGAQSSPAVRHEPHLQDLDWLTHGTWTAEMTTPDGKPFIIQNEIRWAETGTAIHFLTRFNHQPHYFGVYLYDPAARQIKFFYSASNGELTIGQAEPGPTELKQNFQVSSEKGVTSYTSLIKRAGEDAYDFAVYQEGSDKPLVAVHYVRK
jgi:hypothetical protein